MILTSSAATIVTVSGLAAAKQYLSAPAYQSLAAATAAGTVKGRSYSQAFNNITDQETQSGYFYYDGSHAWVTQSYRGTQGNHQCNVSWAVGYYVTNTGCTDTGSTSQRNLTMSWLIQVGIKGSPISWGESHTMHVNSAGSIWQQPLSERGKMPCSPIQLHRYI
ncbi:hypothetical protein [Leifsonia xyli]|uniref:hypothetical protein n=1 Tax=Leifsonia xyli TaxID=1575 RepID=UPI00114CABB6|nr:hypothetical protein [Leifsonia xyli]